MQDNVNREWFTMSNPFVQKQNITLARGAFKQQQMQLQIDAIATWISMALGVNVPNEPAAFQESLKDGVHLCNLLKKISPSTNIKINSSGRINDFTKMENIGAYLKASKELGIRSSFLPADLYEGKDLHKVLVSVLELGDLARRNGFKPCVGDKPPEKPAPPSPRVVIDENELEVPETEIEESNLKEHEELEKQSEEVLLKLIEAEKKKEEEEKRRQNAELEMQQLKAEMEKLRLENEKLKSKPEAPQLIFGNTPATQGEKDCFIAKFLGQEPIPSDEGRMVVVVVSIEGISVLVPYTEVPVIVALWRRVKSWGVSSAGDMFKFEYLPLKAMDDNCVPAWFMCPESTRVLDSIMTWIAKKKEQLQAAQAKNPGSIPQPRPSPRGYGREAKKSSFLSRMMGKGK